MSGDYHERQVRLLLEAKLRDAVFRLRIWMVIAALGWIVAGCLAKAQVEIMQAVFE